MFDEWVYRLYFVMHSLRWFVKDAWGSGCIERKEQVYNFSRGKGACVLIWTSKGLLPALLLLPTHAVIDSLPCKYPLNICTQCTDKKLKQTDTHTYKEAHLRMQCKQAGLVYSYEYSCLSMVYIRDNGSVKINGFPVFHIETVATVLFTTQVPFAWFAHNILSS